MGPTAPTPLLACVLLAEASRRSLPFSRGAHPHPPSLTFRDLLASLIGDAVLIRRPHSRRGGARPSVTPTAGAPRGPRVPPIATSFHGAAASAPALCDRLTSGALVHHDR